MPSIVAEDCLASPTCAASTAGDASTTTSASFHTKRFFFFFLRFLLFFAPSYEPPVELPTASVPGTESDLATDEGACVDATPAAEIDCGALVVKILLDDLLELDLLFLELRLDREVLLVADVRRRRAILLRPS